MHYADVLAARTEFIARVPECAYVRVCMCACVSPCAEKVGRDRLENTHSSHLSVPFYISRRIPPMHRTGASHKRCARLHLKHYTLVTRLNNDALNSQSPSPLVCSTCGSNSQSRKLRTKCSLYVVPNQSQTHNGRRIGGVRWLGNISDCWKYSISIQMPFVSIKSLPFYN